MNARARIVHGVAAALGAALAFTPAARAPAAPAVERTPDRIAVSGLAYRITFRAETGGVAAFELRGADGAWRNVAQRAHDIAPGLYDGSEHPLDGTRATSAIEQRDGVVAVGQRVPLDGAPGLEIELLFLCADEGVLVGGRLHGMRPRDAGARFWMPPRIRLDPPRWDSYRFWDERDRCHEGSITSLGAPPAYAGASSWGRAGDVVAALSPRRPALLLRGAAWQSDLGIVGAGGDTTREIFLQRHTPEAVFLYGGVGAVPAPGQIAWGWIAPAPKHDAESAGRWADRLVTRGRALAAGVRLAAPPPVPEAWTCVSAEVPAALRRGTPVQDLNDAAVFIVGEHIDSERGIDLVRRVAPDVVVRGWFKWGAAPPVARRAWIPPRVRALGALFGGGLTCSALYDGENGITREQLLDMATRGADGALVDAWGRPGIRHGSLSSPAYLDHLFRWAREQIDAGVDWLFLDEHTAALEPREGYDSHSLDGFRRYLAGECLETRGWSADDRRWRERFGIDTGDRALCPDGTVRSFDYRRYLRERGCVEDPLAPANPLAPCWRRFRAWRDERAWEALTGRIRAHAAGRGRVVHLSANGLARHVDLQLLGVWGEWRADNGRIDLDESQIPTWRATVRAGERAAGRRVPVVFFHDWGMGDPPFPYLGVPPSERELWLRVRAAEMSAAGARFAYPVLGPFGCDAARDGTFPCIVRQTAFLQRHRDMFPRARFLGSERLGSDTPGLSLAAAALPDGRTLLIHAINRNTRSDPGSGARVPRPLECVRVRFALDAEPAESVAVSPEWPGARALAWQRDDDALEIGFSRLEAWAVGILRFHEPVSFASLADPPRVRPLCRWERPETSEFRVMASGELEPEDEFNGLLQGALHRHLRNPPSLVFDALDPGMMLVRVRSVARAGARLECRIDGHPAGALDLPDRDGRNEIGAREWDRTLEVRLPAGCHRLDLDNTGADWLSVESIEFRGRFRNAH